MSKEEPLECFFKGILSEAIENAMKEFSVTSSDELVSDQTRIERKGIFIEEKPKFNVGASLLTHALQTRTLGSSYHSLGHIKLLDPNDPNYHIIKVFVLETSQELSIEASKENTIEELIKHVYSVCTQMERDEIQLPYKTSRGYELRLAYDGQPIYEMGALENTKTLGEYDLDVAAFCAKKGFRPPCSKSKVDECSSRNRPGMVKLKVHVYTNKEDVTLCIQSEPTQSLEDLFGKIAIKRGLKRSNLYKFMKYSELLNYGENISTLLKYNEETNIKVLNMKTPIGYLKFSEVILFERYFPDIPEGFSQLKCSVNIDTQFLHVQRQKSVWEEQLRSDTDSSYEYHVVRTRGNEQKCNRILVIDRYAIYNQKYKNSDTLMNGKYYSNFSVINTYV
jgi:hypothetical protein